MWGWKLQLKSKLSCKPALEGFVVWDAGRHLCAFPSHVSAYSSIMSRGSHMFWHGPEPHVDGVWGRGCIRRTGSWTCVCGAAEQLGTRVLSERRRVRGLRRGQALWERSSLGRHDNQVGEVMRKTHLNHSLALEKETTCTLVLFSSGPIDCAFSSLCHCSYY